MYFNMPGRPGVGWPHAHCAARCCCLQGAEISFAVQPGPGALLDPATRPQLSVYTTRPDTLFGVTYMVLAPEHPLLPALTSSSQRSMVKVRGCLPAWGNQHQQGCPP